MSDAPIIIAGHSHVVAIVGPTKAAAPEIHPATNFPNVFALFGPWPRDEAYWGTLAARARGADIALVWRGNEHNEHFFFRSHRPFDLYSSNVPVITRSLNIISQQQVRKFFNPHFEDLPKVLKTLNEAGAKRVRLIGTPPPKKDEQFLREMMKVEPHFAIGVAFREKSFEDVELTPPHIRLKLWYVIQGIMRDHARANQADFIAVPDAVKDPEGFLKREYWHQDITHANAAYGEVIAEMIIRSFRS